MERVSIDFRGKQYTAELSRGSAPRSAEANAPAVPTWHVMLGPTPLTEFPAAIGDTEASVRERALAWIRGHPELADRDQIHLGGG